MSDSQKRMLLLSPKANIVALATALILAGIIPPLLLIYTDIDREVVSALRTILYIIFGIMLGGTVIQYIFTYLDPKSSRESNISQQELLADISNIFSKQIDELRYEIKSKETVKVGIEGLDEDKFLESIKSTVGERFTHSILKSVDQEFAKRDLQNKRWERYVTSFEEIKVRLKVETDNLTRRTNLNLLLGAGTTILALTGLVAIIFLLPFNLKDYPEDKYGWAIFAHYIPRLSLIVFAQLFAYFFLRLYKSGLEDIKYYQNEITNVELKISALKVALATEENEILKLVIEELVKVERNFILKKDETTVELEKFKAESLSTKDLLAHITSLLETKK